MNGSAPGNQTKQEIPRQRFIDDASPNRQRRWRCGCSNGRSVLCVCSRASGLSARLLGGRVVPTVKRAKSLFAKHVTELEMRDVEGEPPYMANFKKQQAQQVGGWLMFLSHRIKDLEQDNAMLRAKDWATGCPPLPTITGARWPTGAGHMLGMVVPIAEWHTRRKPDPPAAIDSAELDSTPLHESNDFWQQMSVGIIGEQTCSEDGNFRIPLDHRYLKIPGLYSVRMMRQDPEWKHYSFGMGNVFYLQEGTQCVVFDVDGTLTVGDQEVITQMITPSYDPERYNAAATMVRLWAAKGYQPIYLSGRQGTFYNGTMSWLIKHGFPPGPIHMTRSAIPTLPIYCSVGVFKVEYVKALQDKGLNIYAAYGNTATDLRAYVNMGIDRDKIFIIGPHEDTIDKEEYKYNHTDELLMSGAPFDVLSGDHSMLCSVEESAERRHGVCSKQYEPATNRDAEEAEDDLISMELAIADSDDLEQVKVKRRDLQGRSQGRKIPNWRYGGGYHDHLAQIMDFPLADQTGQDTPYKCLDWGATFWGYEQ